MTIHIKIRLLRAVAGIAFGLLAFTFTGLAAAEPFPSRPIKLVVPWPAGGVVDVRTRLIAHHLGKALGQQVVVENKPGASGTIGASAVARAAPDGYTLLFGSFVDQATVLSLMRSVPYSPEKDFVAIAPLGRSCTALLVPPSLGVKSAAELVALVRKKPGELTYAHAGIGTPSHLLAEQLKLHHKLDISAVQYKGAGPALPDVAAGHVHMIFDFVPSSASYVQAGKLNPLMTGCGRRLDAYPAAPSAIEAGFPELDVPSWGGLFAPAGTPIEIVERLNREVNRIQQSPDVRSHLAYAGAEIPIMSAQEFADFVRKDRPRWGDLARQAGVRPE
jgi:tripartite-type tricarboxylate transporter receptor subunit TctC